MFEHKYMIFVLYFSVQNSLFTDTSYLKFYFYAISFKADIRVTDQQGRRLREHGVF